MKANKNKKYKNAPKTIFSKRTWNGYERRTKARRAEDLKRCVLCNIHFPWEYSIPVCSACAEKLLGMYNHKGKIVNIIA